MCGFLQVGEFTIPLTPSIAHLSLSELSINRHVHTAPSVVRLRSKHNKTNSFFQGVNIYPGASALAVTSDFAQSRPCSFTLLSDFQSMFLGKTSHIPFWCLNFMSQACVYCTQLGQSMPHGHSFRIGATTMAAQGVHVNSQIQTLGRWKSRAYKVSIKLQSQADRCLNEPACYYCLTTQIPCPVERFS